MNPYRELAERLVTLGYATHFKPIPYGLTKSTTYEVYVNGRGWELVNPFGFGKYSNEQQYALTIEGRLRNTLTRLLKYLGEDELLHFKKIHQKITNMSEEKLNDAVDLVKRTLDRNGIDYT